MLSSSAGSSSMSRITGPSFVAIAVRRNLKLSIVVTIQRTMVKGRTQLRGREKPAMAAPTRLRASKS